MDPTPRELLQEQRRRDAPGVIERLGIKPIVFQEQAQPIRLTEEQEKLAEANLHKMNEAFKRGGKAELRKALDEIFGED